MPAPGPPGPRAPWAQAAVAMAAGATLLVGGLGLLDKIDAGSATEAEVDAWVASTRAIGNGTTLLEVLGGICVLAWLYRAVANVSALGRGIPHWSPACRDRRRDRRGVVGSLPPRHDRLADRRGPLRQRDDDR